MPSIALVGRPNVGKSRLFNALVGRRLAIVHDQPGVTRDVKTAETREGYVIMDTGGLGLDRLVTAGRAMKRGEKPPATTDKRGQHRPADHAELVSAVEEQVSFAIQVADAVLFVVDGKEGPAALDEALADELRETGKPVALVVNKLDAPEQDHKADEFLYFGIEPTFSISAEHLRGIKDVRSWIADTLGPVEKEAEDVDSTDRRVTIAFAGRPNVGKSLLMNRLLRNDRLVVSEIPGTTRDTVEMDLDYTAKGGESWRFRLVDTAGLRRKTKMSSPVEVFSALRSEDALQRADVVLHVVDARDGITTMDKNLAGVFSEAGRASIVVVNKWDIAREAFADEGLPGYASIDEFRKAFVRATREEVFFLPDSPMVFVSAKTNYAIERMLKLAREVDARQRQKLPTGPLNRKMQELLAKAPPRRVRGRPFKVYYVTQTGTQPYRLRCFCNQPAKLDESYRRYLQKGVIDAFDLQGCPIRFDFVGKEKPEKFKKLDERLQRPAARARTKKNARKLARKRLRK